MSFSPGWMLGSIAAASWTAVIAVDALNWHPHIWIATLSVAGITTILAFQWLMFSRLRQQQRQENQRLQEAITGMSQAYTQLALAVTELLADPKTPGGRAPLRVLPGPGRHAAE